MKFLIALTIIFSISSTSLANSFGMRGGGDECVKRFIQIGETIALNLKYINIDLPKFLEKINTATVTSVETEYISIDGNNYYAVNDPMNNTITVSQKWCEDSKKPNRNVPIIVAHEFLGLSQPGTDKNYAISNFIYEDLGLNEEQIFNLVATGNRDANLTTTKIYNELLDLTGHTLTTKYTINDEFSQTAFICCGTYTSFVDLAHTFKDKTYVNRFSIDNKYCRNKLFEITQNYTNQTGLSFKLGLDSKTVYEIFVTF